jgi:predicted Zn-ribbon and HTH transcriptional regulator
MKNIQINECCKCKHRWKQRGKNKPKKCPICKSIKWNEKENKRTTNILRYIIGR